MDKDKRQHFGFALLAVPAVWLLVWLANNVGMWAAFGAATTMIGFGFEGIQKFRKEGEPSLADALWTSAAGWVAGGAYYLAGL